MMLYVSFCKEVESQWASLKQTSEVYFARYHLTTGLLLSVGYLVVNSVILDWSKLKKQNVFVASTSGESLLTSLFAFWLISIRVNPWRAQPFAQIKFKSWKSWLICTILQFSAFESNNKGNNRYRKVRNCFGVAKMLITWMVILPHKSYGQLSPQTYLRTQ